ncbi:excalibur calcium-binding domain-containing protein [Pseudoxanthomonas taiwanensis]|nr:excalibur calcium-binding domain-containing protein [Pseudoxanthomonas taiwanensis]
MSRSWWLLLVVLLAPLAPLAQAHPGGLNAEGCHHCHRAPAGNAASQAQSLQAPARAAPANGRAFRNCAEARAAGAAPVRRGDPGYGPHLDRDNDGIGCE